MNQYSIVPGSLAAIAQRDGATLAESFLSAEAIILIDMSGSMAVSDAPAGARYELGAPMRTRYDAAEDELRRLQAQLPGKVAVVAFSSTVEFVPGGVPPRLGGGTDMAGALRFVRPADGTGTRIILISDGEPDSESETLAVAGQFETQIDCIYIGQEGDRGQHFLKRLADATGGRAFKSNQPGLLKGAVEQLLLTD
jgi:hypothetical protein